MKRLQRLARSTCEGRRRAGVTKEGPLDDEDSSCQEFGAPPPGQVLARLRPRVKLAPRCTKRTSQGSKLARVTKTHLDKDDFSFQGFGAPPPVKISAHRAQRLPAV
eukprot:8678237-Pyramimonas_sp.AAC.1